MPLYEMVLNTEYQGQQCVNRWNYMTTSVPAAVTLSYGLLAAAGFIQGLGDVDFPAGSLAELIRSLVNTGVTFVSVVAKEIWVLPDFYSTPFNTGTIGGATSGDLAAPFLAYGVHSNQTTRRVRAGTKRFVGVSEGFMGAGGLLDGISIGVLADICVAMNNNLSYDDEGSILQYQPVVVHKEKIVDPVTGKITYKYYPSEAEQIPANVAQNVVWSPMPYVRSQTSRQYKHGR